MKTLTVIDLFSGCGGLSYGLYQANFKILAGIDKWETALKTFQINHKEALTICTDLTQFKPQKLMKQLGLNQGDLDCLVGGPPCQGFSKNVPAAYRFLADPRNLLFRNYLNWVKELYPKIVLMENVAPIYNAYGGAVRHEIIETLEKRGYKVKVKVLWAHDYGVPQRRQRCFFFASRTGISPYFPEPTFAQKVENTLFEIKQQHRSAWFAISDLPVLQNGEGYEPIAYDMPPQNDYQKIMRENSPILWDHITRQLKDKQFARISSLKAGEGIKDLPPEIRPKAGYSGAYGRLDFEMVAPTITRWVFHPGSGRFCHPREVRLITIREAARIQSFPDEFRFTGTYIDKSHQIGNAVPPLLMRVFAKHIRACLTDSIVDSQLDRVPVGED